MNREETCRYKYKCKYKKIPYIQICTISKKNEPSCEWGERLAKINTHLGACCGQILTSTSKSIYKDKKLIKAPKQMIKQWVACIKENKTNKKTKHVLSVSNKTNNKTMCCLRQMMPSFVSIWFRGLFHFCSFLVILDSNEEYLSKENHIWEKNIC